MAIGKQLSVSTTKSSFTFSAMTNFSNVYYYIQGRALQEFYICTNKAGWGVYQLECSQLQVTENATESSLNNEEICHLI